MSQSVLGDGRRDVRVRLCVDADRIEAVRLKVVPRNSDLDEIRIGCLTLGYVERVGNVFVALIGERLDRAEECAQSLLWDVAAAALVRHTKRNDSSPASLALAAASLALAS